MPVGDPRRDATTLADPPAAESGSLEGGGSRSTRRQLALLNFVRRTSAQPAYSVLVEDAAILAAWGVEADRCAWGQLIPGDQYRITLACVGSPQQPGERMTETFPIEGTAIGERVIRRAEVVVDGDSAEAGQVLDPFLRRQGLAGGITVPLHRNARTHGVLGVYSLGRRAWDREEVAFVETVAHMLTAASARLAAEEELDKERTTRAAILETVDAVVVTLDLQGRVLDINPGGQRLTGYTLSEVRDAPFWSKFVPPGEADVIQEIFRSSRGQAFASEYAGWLLAKDGSQRRVSWTIKALCCGEVQSIMLTGVDRTEQWKTTDKLRQMTAVARHVMEALHGTPEEKARRLAEAGFGADVAAVFQPPSHDQDGGRAAGAIGAAGGASAEPQVAPPGAERRANRRHPYPYRQRFAPILGGRLPRLEEFAMVECHDISAGGAAFYYDRVPEFKELVLALGQPPRVSEVVCRVVRVAGAQRDGRKRYLVGCRFVGRCQ